MRPKQQPFREIDHRDDQINYTCATSIQTCKRVLNLSGYIIRSFIKTISADPTTAPFRVGRSHLLQLSSVANFLLSSMLSGSAITSISRKPNNHALFRASGTLTLKYNLRMGLVMGERIQIIHFFVIDITFRALLFPALGSPDGFTRELCSVSISEASRGVLHVPYERDVREQSPLELRELWEPPELLQGADLGVVHSRAHAPQELSGGVGAQGLPLRGPEAEAVLENAALLLREGSSALATAASRSLRTPHTCCRSRRSPTHRPNRPTTRPSRAASTPRR